MRNSIAVSFLLLSLEAEAKLPWKDQKPAHEKVEALRNITVKEHLGERINLDLSFTNEAGASVKLQDFFARQKPILLTLVYYTCPALCRNSVLNSFFFSKAVAGVSFGSKLTAINSKSCPVIKSICLRAVITPLR